MYHLLFSNFLLLFLFHFRVYNLLYSFLPLKYVWMKMTALNWKVSFIAVIDEHTVKATKCVFLFLYKFRKPRALNSDPKFSRNSGTIDFTHYYSRVEWEWNSRLFFISLKNSIKIFLFSVFVSLCCRWHYMHGKTINCMRGARTSCVRWVNERTPAASLERVIWAPRLWMVSTLCTSWGWIENTKRRATGLQDGFHLIILWVWIDYWMMILLRILESIYFWFFQSAELSVFETNIRFVGGLLTLYAFTGDEMYKEKAQHVADKLLPAFQTPTGIPNALVNVRTGVSTLQESRMVWLN